MAMQQRDTITMEGAKVLGSIAALPHTCWWVRGCCALRLGIAWRTTDDVSASMCIPPGQSRGLGRGGRQVPACRRACLCR